MKVLENENIRQALVMIACYLKRLYFESGCLNFDKSRVEERKI